MDHQRENVTTPAAFHFQESTEKRFIEIKQYIERLDKTEEPFSSVTLYLADDKISVNSTILAALSPFWSKFLHSRGNDEQILFKIPLDVSCGAECLHMIKTLLYFGRTTLSVSLIEDVMAILRLINLNSSDFVLTNTGNNLECLVWENHFEHLVKGLQSMCKEKQCTDFSLLIDGHVIKVHTFVLSAYSTVLDELFKENMRIRTMHIRGVSMKCVRSLIAFMYFGKGIVSELDIKEFSRLCSSLNVKSLFKMTRNHLCETYDLEKKHENTFNVFAKVAPEVTGIIKKLQLLYDQQGKTDLTLLVEKKKFYSHKCIVGISSPIVHAMLMQEQSNEPSAILLTDADSESITCLLTLIYNGACFMSKSQMNLAMSYLDATLFHLDVSKNTLSEPKDSATTPKNCLKNSPSLFVMPRDPDTSSSPNSILDQRSYYQHPKSTFRNEASKSISSKNTKDMLDTAYDASSDISDISVSTKNSLKRKRKVRNYKDLLSQYAAEDSSKSVTNTTLHNHVERKKLKHLPPKRRQVSKVFTDDWVTSSSEASSPKQSSFKKKQNSIICEFCVKTFSTNTCLKRHMKNIHGKCIEKPTDTVQAVAMTCELCNCKVTEREILSHMKLHGGSVCCCCKKVFPTESHLYQHLKSKYGVDETGSSTLDESSTDCEASKSSYECSQCNTPFRTERQLKIHSRQHKNKHKIISSKVIKKQKKAPRRKLLNSVQKRGRPRKKDKYLCGHCKISFSNYDAFIEHGYQSEDCETFIKIFDARNEERPKTIRQSQVSTKVKNPWTCSVCTFKCSDYASLSKHISALHAENDTTDEETFSSSNSQVASPSNSLLEASKTTGDNENSDCSSFMCPECGEQFENIDDFSAHAEQQGHGTFEGSCWICGVCKIAFFSEKELNEHLVFHDPVPDHLLNSDKGESSNVLKEVDSGGTTVNITSNSKDAIAECLIDERLLFSKSEADSSVVENNHIK